jgi:hypothetical protein
MQRSWLFPIAFVSACQGDISGTLSPDAGPGADAAAWPPEATDPELYGADRSVSPITSYVAANLREIAARGQGQKDDVFAKLGDSTTVSASFMHCFNSGYLDPAPGEEPGSIELGGRDSLKDAIAHFRDGDAVGVTPYERVSLAAGVGWDAADALAGDPAPMDREYAAIAPLFAVIMLGTNDVDTGDFDGYGTALIELADRSIAAGVIPIFTSLMPRDDDLALDADVPHYNALIRGVAQSRQVPFIDLYRELGGLPARGLGPDGVHPSVYRIDGALAPCVFDSQGLEHGYNMRNLLTMETLDRLRRVLIAGEPAPDAPARSIQGTGSAADPFIIDELPFAHIADTSRQGERNLDSYPGCLATQNESGPEVMYRFEADRPMRVRALVVDRGSTDIDIHLLAGQADGDACVVRAHQDISAVLEPGTYYLSLDTFVNASGELVGEYLVTLVEEPL